MQNAYSPTWFSTFLKPIPAEQTEQEVDFLAAHLPNPPYSTVLDLCCGTGRHALRLAERGYRVLGVDRDPAAIAEAQRHAGEKATFAIGDMRSLDELPHELDAIVSLWQSFGYFDAETNRELLRQMAWKLRPGGRLILDLYHRGFFEDHQGVAHFQRGELAIREEKRVAGRRLHVRLRYGTTENEDRFDWEVFTPEELVTLAAGYGLQCLLQCSGFDPLHAASRAAPRMQLMFQRG